MLLVNSRCFPPISAQIFLISLKDILMGMDYMYRSLGYLAFGFKEMSISLTSFVTIFLLFNDVTPFTQKKKTA